MRTLLTGGVVVPGPAAEPPVLADLLLDGEVISALLPPGSPCPPDAAQRDMRGKLILPGFVQIHVHLVQALFRGLADDLALLEWLRTRIWPLERAHDDDSVYWSARLGLTEMLLGGTTAILDMATVHNTDAVFRAASEVGINAFIGKAMMDLDNEAGLGETTAQSLDSSAALCERWHGKGNLHYAYAPRFVPSCSETLLRETVALARGRGCLLHTHASENLGEVALVRALTGHDNVVWLDQVGLTGPDVVLAHCIHLTEEEKGILARTGTTVAHCPSSNLKLSSGIAPIPELLRAGVRVGLGADGAPCNNRMDALTELRLAALIQKPRLGAATLPAPAVLELGTTSGARALGLNAGIIAPGARADLAILDEDAIYALGGGDPRGAVVYAHTAASVRETWIGGRPVTQNGAVLGWDTAETVAGCKAALGRVRERAGL